MWTHTPGPWILGEYPKAEGWFIKGVGDTIPLCSSQHATARSFANARLIAASPRMFDYITKRAAEGDRDAAEILASIT